MIEVVLVLAIVIGVVVAFMKLTVGWGGDLILKDVVGRMQAGETIVSGGKLPDEWLTAHRRRIAVLRQAGKSQAEIDRAGRTAQKACLRKIDELLAFFRGTNLTDSPDTKALLLRVIQERRERVSSQSWEILLANQPDPLAGEDED